jgi:hypothetical protein
MLDEQRVLVEDFADETGTVAGFSPLPASTFANGVIALAAARRQV